MSPPNSAQIASPTAPTVFTASPSTTGGGSGRNERCSSAGSGVTAVSSILSAVSAGSTFDLPSTSYDGAHLHWKAFRRDVLAPHRICVIEGPPKQALPESLVALIEASQGDGGKFETQKLSFRQQVSQGRGFGPSPLFPPNLLPSIDSEPKLARCMVPSFGREALPERVLNHNGPFYELSIPRSGLGCGFSNGALSDEEVKKLPQYMSATGTVVHFDTGYIAPGASLYCPFLVFERTFGQKEHRLETANNQCAIAGAWCTRSLQMLYSQAWSVTDKDRPDLPVSFSCTIDNDIAILNYHWIDGSQCYCMSPMCKFDLANDEHFEQFNIWIEAIGQWGLRTLLPNLKRALSCLGNLSPTLLEIEQLKKPDLKIDTFLSEERLVTALKTSFSQIPWRLDDDDFTPVSSSIASWGSPIINEFYYNNLPYPAVPRMQSGSAGVSSRSGRADSKPPSTTPVPAQNMPQQNLRRFRISTPITPSALSFASNGNSAGGMTPPPQYALNGNTELVWQKRLGHAMDEIQNLQAQLQQLQHAMNGLNTSFQTELSGLKNTMTTMLRKETTSTMTTHHTRFVSGPNGLSINTTNALQTMKGASDTISLEASRQQMQSEGSVITTPTEPDPKRPTWDRFQPQRSRSTLQQVMTIDTNTGTTTTLQADKANGYDSDTIKEDKPCIREIPLPTSRTMNGSHTSRFSLLTPGPLSSFSVRSDGTNIIVVPPSPPKALDVVKWSAALLGIQTLGSFIPSTILRVVFLGCVTDFALLAFASPHWPSTARYLMELFSEHDT